MKTVNRDYWPTQEWRFLDPVCLGIESEKLLTLEQMIKLQYKNIKGIVVIRKGYIAFERYYHGNSPLVSNHVASVTKTFISALIGIAIEAGFLKSVNQKVLNFFPEYVHGADDIQKRTTTIKHLLTMTAPFALNKGKYEPLDRLRRQRDWVGYILNLLGGRGQSGRFQYSTASTHLLSAIITRTTGMSARQFANERLFRPLGMNVIPDQEMKSFTIDDVFGEDLTGWIKDPAGNSTGGWGLTITLRDMARFGLLYLNRGLWDNQQIISENWVAESITTHSQTEINQTTYKYGYLWWLREENGTFLHLAIGDGGNLICCLPQKDLVVAITAKLVRKPQDYWPLFEKCILPAIGE